MDRQDAADAKFRGQGWSEPSPELDRLAQPVIGAAIEVHRHLGPGFLETVYEHAMMIELTSKRISVQRQVSIEIAYKGHSLPSAQVDLLVENELVVELKAVDRIAPIHAAQVLSYLKAGSFQLGLLINFNVPLLKQGLRRVIWSD
jgi:GxxExxY protein